MDFNEIITFEGGLNTDDTPQNMPKGDYRDFSYCRLGFNSGNAFAVETSDGTIRMTNFSIAPNDRVLGATQWLKENAIVYFLYKDNGIHEIWVYYISTQTHVVALRGSELNFSIDWPIFHANVIDDILKWTDGRWDPVMYEPDGTRLFNPPYQINLRKALELPSPNGFYGTIELQSIDAVKWPLPPPRVSYFTDTTRNDNKLRGKLFKFIIQPIYENGELGVWSMYSNLDLPEISELVSGTNWVSLNNSNCIRIEFYTGPKTIRKFNIAVQQFDKESYGAEPPFAVFIQLDKIQDSIQDKIYHVINFYGGVSTSPAFDVFKNYDRLPITADCQEYLPTNQLVYTNFREGYDRPTTPRQRLDVSMDYEVNEIKYFGFRNLILEITKTGIFGLAGAFTSRWDVLPPINIFQWNPGDIVSMTLRFVSYNPDSVTVSYTVSQDDIQFVVSNAPVLGNANRTMLSYRVIPGLAAAINAIIPGAVTPDPLPTPGITSSYVLNFNYPVSEMWVNAQSVPTSSPSGPINYGEIPVIRSTNCLPSLKVGATHEFGIVYGDRAYRDGTVYTVDSMNLFVPWYYVLSIYGGLTNSKNPFSINPKFTINHVPPIWADRYWIVSKPATEISSFGQYIINASDTGGLISAITYDANNSRYKIEIDNYYEINNEGATIKHEIKKGDKLRFIRSNGVTNEYLPYLEVDILDFDNTGSNGRKVVYTNLFDTGIIEPDLPGSNNNLFGQQIEIYTPRPSIDDTGNVFVSTWKDISDSIEIRNAHTEDRAHGAPVKYYFNVGYPTGTVLYPFSFYVNGDYTFLNGTTQNITIYYNDNTTTVVNSVSITSATYYPSDNFSTFTIAGVTPVFPMSYVSLDNDYQVVNGGIPFNPAQFTLPYGDVYLRQRNCLTGLNDENSIYYYYFEDPHYSDYWNSDIHNTGRFRVEDQNTKTVQRKASSIHSDSFIVGTQINGLSSFGLDNQNIEDMNPLYGDIVRTYMSGREGKTLKCLQPKRENSIYIQFYPNEVGSDSSVRVSNKTFASWFDYKSLFGCSDAGATALLPNGSVMYFDNNSGVFIYSGGNGQIVVSEIDPDTGKDYKFRTKTKSLAKAYNESLALGITPLVRTYINETVGEVGFAFSFDNEETYEHVVFDYVNMRWRSTYDYNFRQFCNLGQTLVGWGKNNQLYLHNQPNVWTFHGDSFIQKVSFVSNENPLLLKRYQDITLISDDKFSIEAVSEPNRSYPLGMKTMMTENLLGMYEGYGKTNYRKNLYDPRFFVVGNESETVSNIWVLNGNQTSLDGEMITIVQDDNNIYTGIIDNPVYNPGLNNTDIELVGLQPDTLGVAGTWYLSEKVLLNGEDVRANALTHTLSYDPSPGGVPGEGSVLFSVGIKGVLS
jgi:hypothetical protein